MTRRFAVALAAVGLLVSVGCSSDEPVTTTASTSPVTLSSGGGSGTTEAPEGTEPEVDLDEVCGLLEELVETEDDDFATVLDILDDVRAASPEDLQEDWDVVIDGVEQLSELGDTEEDFEAAFDIFSDPDFLDAAERVNDFAADECDVDLGLSEEELLGDLPDSSTTTTDRDTTTTDPDADPTSIDAVQAHLAGEYGSEDWWPFLDDAMSWSSTGMGDLTEWEVILADTLAATGLPASSFVGACDALATYLDANETTDVTVVIKDADEVAIASREVGAACAPA